MSDLDDVIERLRSVSEDLSDRAIHLLSEATRSRATERPEEERAITQARRAVEKAISILERAQDRRAERD